MGAPVGAPLGLPVTLSCLKDLRKLPQLGGCFPDVGACCCLVDGVDSEGGDPSATSRDVVLDCISGGGVAAVASGEGKGYPKAAAACWSAAWAVALTEASMRVLVASQSKGAACTGSDGGLMRGGMVNM